MRFAWPAPSGWQYTSRDKIKHLLAWQWHGAQLICVSCMPIGTGLELSERFPEWSDAIGDVSPWTVDSDALEEELPTSSALSRRSGNHPIAHIAGAPVKAVAPARVRG